MLKSENPDCMPKERQNQIKKSAVSLMTYEDYMFYLTENEIASFINNLGKNNFYITKV